MFKKMIETAIVNYFSNVKLDDVLNLVKKILEKRGLTNAKLLELFKK